MNDSNIALPRACPESKTCRFAGLSNQGATCYMNSLLQTLFLTPEFRCSLYNFRYVSRIHGPAKDCIPLQLQLLFARLQLQQFAYQDTVALMRSFQWDPREAFEQCDVQEFCRVLFDAIELSVKQSPDLKNLITDLFSGHLRTFIDCHSCGLRSSNTDTFLDLSLSISTEELCSRSLYDALDSYFKPELLTGENKYMCQVCEAKTDAMRTQEMLRPPYILFLHLKRFTIDPVTFGRCKINSEVQFPFLLNMTRYISSETIGESNQNGGLGVQEHLYELYSVLVHSGSAMGGHYSAFIFSFADHQWYHFNDTAVAEVPESHIAKTYGDSLNSNTQLYSGSSAYVLCYRKLDEKNMSDVPDEEVPRHVREMMESQEFEAKPQDFTNPSSEAIMIKVQIHFRHQVEPLEVCDDESLIRLLELAKLRYGLESIADANLRLRSIDPDSGAPLETFHGREHLPLRDLNIGNLQALEIEVKSADERFEEFDQSGICLNIFLWSEECWEFPDKPIREKCSSRRMCITRNCLIADLLFLLSSETGIPIELLCVVTHQKEFLSSPNYHLSCASEVLKNNASIYVELLDGSNAGSKWETEIDKDRYRVTVRYFSQSLHIDSVLIVDSRISADRLKQCIADESHLEPRSFSLRLLGEEVDGDAPIHRVINGAQDAAFEIADVRKPDEILLNFVLADLTLNGDGCYSFLPLCQLPVEESTTCQEVKRMVLNKLGDPQLQETQLLIRPRFGLRLSRPLHSFDTFKSSLVYEQRNFAVQLLPESTPDLDPDAVIILVKRVKLGKFASIHEFPVMRHLTLEEFGIAVAKEVGLSAASIQISKVAFSCNASESRCERWMQMSSASFQILSGSPWFLGPDGALFLAKDDDAEVAEAKEESKGNNRREERSMRISVKPQPSD